MINILNKSQCCGCSACINICPKKCIRMKRDDEGFEYPIVDSNKCVNCGLCEKVCPVSNAKNNISQSIKAYVAYSKEENIRLQSSSGGIFSVLAEEILDKKGIVFGAAFDEEFLVHHIGITEKEDLLKLRGSKYLQSSIGTTFGEAKRFLDEGRLVLYSGTACQIAGLKSYLGKEYDNLYTIDVLCHGVPSPKVWKQYLKYQEKQYHSNVDKVFFRKKDTGWKNYSIALLFKDNSHYKTRFHEDIFMKLFLKNICLRPSCHECKFKIIERPSDITLGDCWGIEKYMPDMDDDKGTSIILTHSKKAENILQDIKRRLVIKEAEIDRVLPPSSDARKSVKMHSKRAQFFQELQKNRSIKRLGRLVDVSWYIKLKRVIKLFNIHKRN